MSLGSRRSSDNSETRSTSDKNAELIAAVFGADGSDEAESKSPPEASSSLEDDDADEDEEEDPGENRQIPESVSTSDDRAVGEAESDAASQSGSAASSRAFSTNVDVDETEQDEEDDIESSGGLEVSSDSEVDNQPTNEVIPKTKPSDLVDSIIDLVASGSSCKLTTPSHEKKSKEKNNNNIPKQVEVVKPKRFRRTKQQMREDSAKAANEAVSSVLQRCSNVNEPPAAAASSASNKKKLLPQPKQEPVTEDEAVPPRRSKAGATTGVLMRECLICKQRMHQDKLSDHYSGHFTRSPKCCNCRKVSTNPANFVTHILSHLPSQFYCTVCDKWFRKPLVYSRHFSDCKPSKAATTATAAAVVTTPVKTRGRKKKVQSQPASTVSTPVSNPKTEAPSSVTVKKERRGRPSLASKLARQIEAMNVKVDPTETRRLIAARTKTRKSTSACELSVSGVAVERRGRKKKSAVLERSRSADREPSPRETTTVAATAVAQDEQEEGDNLSTAANEDEEEPPDEDDDDDEHDPDEQENDIDELAVSDYEMDDKSSESTSRRQPPDSGTKKSEKPEETKVNSELNKEQSYPALTPQKELASVGTYKVRIQPRRAVGFAANSATGSESVTASPVKSSTSAQSLLVRTLSSNSVMMTPTKTSSNTQLLGAADAATSSAPPPLPPLQNNFECPECEKKFVSYYGLVQHYDQHPTLAVTCAYCDITFDDHHALVVHNSNVHQLCESSMGGGLIGAPTASTTASLPASSTNPASNKDSRENQQGSTRKPETSSQQSSGKQLKQLKTKASQAASEDTEPSTISSMNDLSHLPSIMTRTSRLSHQNQQNGHPSLMAHQHHHHHHHPTLLPITHSLSSKPATISAQAIANHNLAVRTSGFADLAFVDFSCKLFPLIAQNLCELWPRALATSDHQPLHKYKCSNCGFYFPCQAALDLHKQRHQWTNQSGRQIASCGWLMTHSKASDYERCIDDIISRIDEQQEREERERDGRAIDGIPTKEQVIKWLDLVEVDANEEAVHSLTPTESMLLKVRAQMLDVNEQYARDLDEWKLNTGGVGTDASKVLLKPLVNIMRPLLIRSKKLKRRGAAASVQAAVPVVTAALPPPFPSPKPLVVSQASSSSQTVSLSRPMFAATSGAFSGVGLAQNSPLVKKRKAEEPVAVKAPAPVNDAVKKRRHRVCENGEQGGNCVASEPAKRMGDNCENRNEIGPSKPAVVSTSMAKKSLIPLVDKKPLKRLQQEPMTRLVERAKIEPPKLTKRELNSSDAVAGHRLMSAAGTAATPQIPAPPPLYKAPSLVNHAGSANSSRLASASGMSNSMIVGKSMPKLQPISSIISTAPSAAVKAVSPLTTPPRAMPKLKPLLPQAAASVTSPQSQPPPLPKFTPPSASISRPVNSSTMSPRANSHSANHSPYNSLTVYPKISPKPSPTSGANPSTSAPSSAITGSAEKSLKCKICFLPFRGQQEFFEHVIVSHPNILKKKLNRGDKSMAISGAASSFRITPVVSSSSTGSSNTSSSYMNGVTSAFSSASSSTSSSTTTT